MTTLEATSVREQSDVRAAVDEKLGRGEGTTPGEAWKRLSGVERVEWILGEFWYGLSGPYHLWIQGQVMGDLDAPRYVAILAELAQALDPETAALMSWTAEQARGVRAEERGEALMSIVPLVWDQALEEAAPVFKALVERWPSGAELDDQQAATPLARALAVPAASGCRFPEVSVGFTEGAAASCDLVAPAPGLAKETALLALWRHGAADKELEAFHSALGEARDRVPEVLAEWVNFDGMGAALDNERFDAFRRSLDPIAAILGIESSRGTILHRVEAERLADLYDQLRPYGAVRIEPDEEASFLVKFRSALRMGPTVALLDSADIETDEDVTLTVNAVWTGTIVVMGGDAPSAQRVVDATN